VTKCTFFKYGSSGTTESRDGLCILALNIINEKVRILLYFPEEERRDLVPDPGPTC
jgi:hypothetical protein